MKLFVVLFCLTVFSHVALGDQLTRSKLDPKLSEGREKALRTCGVNHASLRTSKRIIAHQSQASALLMVFSYSLERSRHCPSQAKVRSTRQRKATGWKPFFVWRPPAWR